MSVSLLNLDVIVQLSKYEQLKHKIVHVQFSALSKQDLKHFLIEDVVVPIVTRWWRKDMHNFIKVDP